MQLKLLYWDLYSLFI